MVFVVETIKNFCYGSIVFFSSEWFTSIYRFTANIYIFKKS